MKILKNILQILKPINRLPILAGFFIFNQAIAQPANDLCVNAEPVIIPASGTICLTGNSTNATTSGEITNCKNPALKEVWFTYIVVGSINSVVVKPTGTNPISSPAVTIRNDGCGALVSDDCNNFNGDSAFVKRGYTAGEQVWIDVAGLLGDGEFEICITSKNSPPIPGNSCGEASWITTKQDFSVNDFGGVTSSGLKPSCFGQTANTDLWFKFMPSKAGKIEWKATPRGNDVEFDFAMYDITNGCPNILDTLDILSKELSCNYNYSGPGNADEIGMYDTIDVGSLDSIVSPCPKSNVTNTKIDEFCPTIQAIPDRIYAIMIDNFDGNATGFDFEWDGDFEIKSPDTIPAGEVGVWPGDINRDNVANYLDLLPLAVAYNEQGPVRQSQDISWFEHLAEDWNKSFLNGENFKHADCNGDSTVNLNDISAIIANYGQTHNKTNTTSGTEADRPLYFDLPLDSAEVGQAVQIPIHFGITGDEVVDLYGIAFAIDYDANLIDSASMVVDFKNSWVGDSSETVSVVYNIEHNGRIEIAICRNDHTNITGSGHIGTLRFVMEDNLAGKTLNSDTLNLRLNGVKAISFDETEIPVLTRDTSFTVWEDANSIKPSNPLNEQIKVYPNPTSSKLYVVYDGANELQYKLFDIAGRLIQSGGLGSARNMLDLEELIKGTYNLSIYSKTETFNKRIILIK